MRVKFKGSDMEYNCTNPIEQKVYRGGVAVGWILSFSFDGNCTSSELDSILTDDGISEICFICQNDENPQSTVIGSYTKLSSCVIRHSDAGTSIEVQLTNMKEE